MHDPAGKGKQRHGLGRAQRQGEILRRFADTNSDNVVDQWCYYLDGLEVYRDIDSNFNGKADQYRWFHTAGTRWGVDKNEDGRIDAWRVISPHEVAEQVVFALKTRDPARFELLLLTPDELSEAGLRQGAGRTQSPSRSKRRRPAFRSSLAEQKIVTPQSRYVDFGSARPATIPAGTAGSTKDVIGDRKRLCAGPNRRQARAGLLGHAGGGRRHMEADRCADRRL